MSIEAGLSALSHWLSESHFVTSFASVVVSASGEWEGLLRELGGLIAGVQSYLKDIEYIPTVPAGVEEVIYNDYVASYHRLFETARAYTMSMSQLRLAISDSLPDGINPIEDQYLERLKIKCETARGLFLKAQSEFEHYRSQLSPFRRV